MKKATLARTDELRPEYDFASMKGGVRGKYARRAREETNIVLIQPEVAEAFPTERAVNEALKGSTPHELYEIRVGCLKRCSRRAARSALPHREGLHDRLAVERWRQTSNRLIRLG